MTLAGWEHDRIARRTRTGIDRARARGRPIGPPAVSDAPPPAGGRLRVAPGYDEALLPDLRRHFSAYSTVAFDHYPVRDLPGTPL